MARATGLFWLQRTENDAPRTGMLYCLRMRCEDLMPGPAPDGHLAACLPEDRARFEPEPARGCGAPAEDPTGTDAPRQ